MLKQRKNLVIVLFVAGLLSPMFGGLFHAFQNHEHNYCFAKNESHLHKSKDHCSNFHHIQNVIQDFEYYQKVDFRSFYYKTAYFLNPQKHDFRNCEIYKLRGPPLNVF